MTQFKLQVSDKLEFIATIKKNEHDFHRVNKKCLTEVILGTKFSYGYITDVSTSKNDKTAVKWICNKIRNYVNKHGMNWSRDHTYQQVMSAISLCALAGYEHGPEYRELGWTRQFTI